MDSQQSKQTGSDDDETMILVEHVVNQIRTDMPKRTASTDHDGLAEKEEEGTIAESPGLVAHKSELLRALEEKDADKVWNLINKGKEKGIKTQTLENLKLCKFIAVLERLKETKCCKYLWRQFKREMGWHEDEERLTESELKKEKEWIEILSDPLYICLDWKCRTDLNRNLSETSSPIPTPAGEAPNENEDIVKTALRYAYLLEQIPLYEHRLSQEEYARKAEGLEEFAAAVVEGSDSDQQGHQIMDLYGTGCFIGDKPNNFIESVGLLKFAAAKKRMKFVTSPKCQHLLNEVIYYDWPYWQRKSLLTVLLWSTLQLIIVASSIWVYIPVRLTRKYLKRKDSRLWKFRERYEHPYCKFVNHNLSYALFLAFIFLTSFGQEFKRSSITHCMERTDWVILAFVFGLLEQELTEIYKQGCYVYFSKWWNRVDTAIIFVFLLSYTIWLIAWGSFQKWKPLATAFTLGEVLYAGGSAVAYFHLTHIFQVHSTMGPLQISLYKMLKDVLRFLFIFLLLYLSFATGLVELYSYYVSSELELHRSNSSEQKPYHPYANHYDALDALFWFLLGVIDEGKMSVKDPAFYLITWFAQLFFKIYAICMVIVALNMLVAMMNNSFQRIMENEDTEWKFSRTQMWLEWIDKGNTIPTPLNLVYTILNVPNLFRNHRNRPWEWFCCGEGPAEYEQIPEKIEERMKTMRTLVDKYLEDRKAKEGKANRRGKSKQNEIALLLQKHLNEITEKIVQIIDQEDTE